MIPKFRITSPVVQNFFASVIVALGPGIYGAITILGAGGGQASAATMANIANSVLYAVYFFVGLVSGSIVTTIGPKWTIAMGTLGYPVYVGGLWYYSSTGHLWYPIFGGAFLGLCAALLWTGCGYIAFSYPEEKQKGLFISMQWGLLSAGGTIASFLAFGLNFDASVAQVPTAVYIVFICLMASGFLVALFLIVPPSSVRRSDGTALAVYPHTGFWSELKAQGQLFKDWRLLALFIPMFASEVAIIVFSTLNATYFNIRTRSLNSVMFTLMQAFGAVGISYLLDNEKWGSRRTRGLISVTVVGVFIIAGWIGITIWLYVNPFDPLNPPAYDWTSGGVFGGFFVLNLMFGVNMVVYQVAVQWIIASFSNDPRRLARFAGLAKGCLAAGLAASFGTEAGGLSQLNVVAFNFSIQAVGILCMLVVCWKCLQPTNYHLEETVIVPVYVEKEAASNISVIEGQSKELPKALVNEKGIAE